MSSKLNAVYDDQRPGCLGVLGQRLHPFQERHEDGSFASSGVTEGDADLQGGTLLERVYVGFETRLLVGPQLQGAGMDKTEQDPRKE